ncbi:MAG: hypothetical protein ACFB00_08540 [Parvularculaceae bacterium]
MSPKKILIQIVGAAAVLAGVAFADEPQGVGDYAAAAAALGHAGGAYEASYASAAAAGSSVAAAAVAANLSGAVALHGQSLADTVVRKVEADIAARIDAIEAARVVIEDLEDF